MFKKKCNYDFELLDDGFKIDQSEIHDPYPLNRVPEDLKHSRFKISIIDPNNYEIINKIGFHSFEVVPKGLNQKNFLYDAHSNWKEITNYCTSSFIIPQILLYHHHQIIHNIRSNSKKLIRIYLFMDH